MGTSLGAIAVLGVAGAIAYGLADAGDLPAASASGTGIPSTYLAEYKAAAKTCRNLDWALLAGVGWIETKHGTYRHAGVRAGHNEAGAAGPMQFLDATFADVRRRHPDVGPDVYDPHTAIRAAAHYLCDSGVARGKTTKALFTYNNSSKYVADVKAAAAAYRAGKRATA